MRQLFYTADGLQMLDMPEPKITNADDVKIRISYCGVCGSDLHFVRKEMDDMLFAETDKFPMGHEASGIITELGPAAAAKGLKIGDKVIYYFNNHCGKCHYCRNGQEQFCENMKSNMSAMADYIVTGEQTVYKLDDNVDLAQAIFHEPISVCLRAIDLAGIKPGNTVLVSGGGAIGLIIMQLAKRSGAVQLTLSEPIAFKRELARELGAVHVIDPSTQDVGETAREITGGRGFDVVIEASGSVHACQGCYDAVGKGGTLEFAAALYRSDYRFPLNLQDSFWRELKIVAGVFQSPYEFPRTLRLFKEMPIEKLMSKDCIFRAEEYQQAFEAQLTGKTIKSILSFE